MRLFRKDIEKRCAYCSFASVLSEQEVACPYRGVTGTEGHCFRFAYDPLKRVPPRPAALRTEGFRAEDFKL